MTAAESHSRRFGIARPEEMAGKSGLEVLQAMLAGELPVPPISEALPFILVQVEHGRALFEGTADARLLNPAGTVHGGFLATMLDSCMTCAVQTTAGVGEFFTTVELKVSFLRPVAGDGRLLRAEGRVLQKTRRAGFAEGRLTDERGRLLGHATTTCLLIDPREG